MDEQLELGFAALQCSSSLQEIRRFGEMDGRTGLELRNTYSMQLPEIAFQTYSEGWNEGAAAIRALVATS